MSPPHPLGPLFGTSLHIPRKCSIVRSTNTYPNTLVKLFTKVSWIDTSLISCLDSRCLFLPSFLPPGLGGLPSPILGTERGLETFREVVMPETQEQFRERIKGEGRWPEFMAYRRALERHGREKMDAWIEAARAFGYDGSYHQDPGKSARARGNPVTLVASAPSDVFKGKDGSVRGDFGWVYDNLGVADITPEEAPSSGAWGLLEYARTEPREFYKSWMSMVSRQADTDERLEGFKEDAARSTDEIAEMLRTLESAVVRAGPEGDGGEPGVPEGSVDEGSDGSGVPEDSVAGLQA